MLASPSVTVLPVRAPFDATADVPEPLGLVGAHRSSRVGQGTELAGLRPFQAGDRLRRISWRVSTRACELHVVTTRGEEDSGVLVVLDALADHGRSGGIDGAASSLDLGVRAAAALSQHFVRTGDRVGLRVLGPTPRAVAPGSGQRHHQLLLGVLAGTRPGRPPGADGPPRRVELGATAGTTVLLLSPLLDESVTDLAAAVMSRGLPLVVLDTLPDALPVVVPGEESQDDLAWRMRLLERDLVRDALAAGGCPVVPWRGPGSLDAVLRRLARRGRVPRTAAR